MFTDFRSTHTRARLMRKRVSALHQTLGASNKLAIVGDAHRCVGDESAMCFEYVAILYFKKNSMNGR